MSLRFTPNTQGGNKLLSVVIGPTGATGATGATGSTGATGATSGIKQAYSSTTTDGDPGAGTFRLNNATPASATEAYLDNIDSGGSTVSTVFDLYDDSTSTVKGYIRFEKSADATVWAQFQVTGSVVDGTGYRKLTLANGAGSGSFTNTDTFAITFTRTGDKGDTGATGATGPAGSMGGPVSSTDNAIVRFDGTGGTTVQDSAVLIDDTTGTTYPAVSDSGALGSATKMWGDLFLASGGVINWNAGDVTVTHSANTLAFAGASSGYSFDAVVLPASSDGAALGSGAVMWSDLFLAGGGVINFNNGDVTATHSANALAFAGASSGYTFDAVVAPASNDGAALGVATTAMWSDVFLASGAVINFNNGDMTITNAAETLTVAGDGGSGKLAVSVAFSETPVALTDGATPALDASLGNIFTLSAAGNRTIAVPTNATAGQKIIIRHFASGADRTLALNTGAGGFNFGTDITGLTATTSGTYDYIGCIYNSTLSLWDVVAYAKGYS